MKCKSDNEQLRCPKCGSEITLWFTSDPLIPLCTNKECETIYQARLDKVLSKFKDLDVKRYNWSDSWDIEYKNNKFYLVIYDMPKKEEQVISLDTVESLLKDLKEE